MDVNFPFPFSAVPASGPGRIAVPCGLGDAGGGGGRASHRPGARPRPRSRPAQRPHPRSARTAPAAAACAMERRVAREFRHKVRRRGRPGPPPRPERRLRAARRPWPGTASPGEPRGTEGEARGLCTALPPARVAASRDGMGVKDLRKREKRIVPQCTSVVRAWHSLFCV